ncbi:unnamed protein product, partial [Pleuronectes platessa]
MTSIIQHDRFHKETQTLKPRQYRACGCINPEAAADSDSTPLFIEILRDSHLLLRRQHRGLVCTTEDLSVKSSGRERAESTRIQFAVAGRLEDEETADQISPGARRLGDSQWDAGISHWAPCCVRITRPLHLTTSFINEQPSSRSLHGFVPVTPEAEAPRCAKAASRCFSLRYDRHKVLTWEWMGDSCYLRLGACAEASGVNP